MKILLVEDEDYKAGHILEECSGHTVIRAKTLYEARLALQSHRDEEEILDAVITDWMFPYREDSMPRDGAGIQVVEESQQMKIPVIVCSGRETIPPEHKAYWVKSNETYRVGAWLNKLNNL